MILTELAVGGVFLVQLERLGDERGYFARTYCAEVFEQHGLDSRIAQCSTSFSAVAGTLRGLHYQDSPHGEAKLVRCTSGAVLDVALDLRPDSPTYLRWQATELSQENGHALFIPAGCAHGFQTSCDASEVLYQMSVPFEPSAARGVRWNDPAFGIEWPEPPPHGRTMSARDAGYADYQP